MIQQTRYTLVHEASIHAWCLRQHIYIYDVSIDRSAYQHIIYLYRQIDRSIDRFVLGVNRTLEVGRSTISFIYIYMLSICIDRQIISIQINRSYRYQYMIRYALVKHLRHQWGKSSFQRQVHVVRRNDRSSYIEINLSIHFDRSIDRQISIQIDRQIDSFVATSSIYIYCDNVYLSSPDRNHRVCAHLALFDIQHIIFLLVDTKIYKDASELSGNYAAFQTSTPLSID